MLALLAASTIWVSAPADPACSLGDVVTGSLSELVPTATIESGDGAAGDELVVQIAPRGDDIDVTLADGWRTVLLTRTLHHGDCRELGESIALIVERYLSDLDWKPAAVVVPAKPRTTVRATTPAPDSHFELAARGLAFVPAGLGGALEAGLAHGVLEVAIEIGGVASRAQPAKSSTGTMIGSIDTSALYALAGAGFARDRIRAVIRAGGERIAASATGDRVFQTADRAAWEALVRGDLGYRFAIAPAVLLEIAGGIEVHPAPVRFTIEGTTATPSSPHVRAVVAASAIWRFP